MRPLLFTIALLVSAACLCAAPVLDHAVFLPDVATPYAWSEGVKEIADFSTRDFQPTGNVKLYVRNTGDKPLTAGQITVDGTPIEQLRERREMLWWRTLPNPVPAGGVAEVLIRPRVSVTKPLQISIAFAGFPALTTTVSPTAPPVRITSVGFNSSLDRVFVVASAMPWAVTPPSSPARVRPQVGRAQGEGGRGGEDAVAVPPFPAGRGARGVGAVAVLLDSRDVTSSSRILSPTFERGVCPVEIRLAKPLQAGSYHVVKLVTKSGAVAACQQRAYDGFVPLGSYGYETVEDYARNGLNGYNNFRVSSKSNADFQAMLGMRGVSITGENPPPAHLVGHPGVFAHCLQDEPDCSDYLAEAWPIAERIGYNAPEMERRAALCRATDPSTLAFLTIDQTYKPANYYVYGQLADVTNHDSYPLTLGWPARAIIGNLDTAFAAIMPHPMLFTYQGAYEKTGDPAKEAKRAFPRQPFPQEERLMMLYGIGCGARGLYNYIHASDGANEGSDQHPEVWNAIGITCRELSLVSPLIAQSCPAPIATSPNKRLWVRGLVAGPQSALVVAANDDYQETADNFVSQPVKNAEIDLANLSWLPVKGVYAVREGAFVPLKWRSTPGETRITVPELSIADVILVTSDPALPARLLAEYQARELKVAVGLLHVARERQAQLAHLKYLLRKIPADYKAFMVTQSEAKAYGIEHAGLWNPLKEKYNGLEFGGTEPGPRVAWKVTVPAERAGKPHTIYTSFGAYGPACTFTVTAANGTVLLQKDEEGDWGGTVHEHKVVFPAAGEYTFAYAQARKGEAGVHVSHVAYVVPEEAAP